MQYSPNGTMRIEGSVIWTERVDRRSYAGSSGAHRSTLGRSRLGGSDCLTAPWRVFLLAGHTNAVYPRQAGFRSICGAMRRLHLPIRALGSSATMGGCGEGCC